MEANEAQHGATVALPSTTSKRPAKRRRGAWQATVAASVMVAAVAGLNWSKVQTVAEKAAVVASVEEAYLRDAWAHYRFKSEVNDLTEQHKSRQTLASHVAAIKVSTFWSCTKLVYYLASDAFRSKADTEAFLTRTAEPHLAVAMRSLGSDIDAAFQRLESNLNANSAQVVTRKEGLRAHEAAQSRAVIDSAAREKLGRAAEELGENLKNTAEIAVFDAEVFKQLVLKLSSRMASLARKTFDRQVKRVSASAAAAAVDGPLLWGDIVAAGLLLWVAYDIHAAGKQFEIDAQQAFYEAIVQANQELRQAAHRTADERVAAHRTYRKAVVEGK